MKVLLIYCHRFDYTPTTKTLDMAEDISEGAVFENVQTAFIQVEEKDMENEKSVTKNLRNLLKWIHRKNQPDHILLHSFAHLSDSKADTEFTIKFLQKIEEWLKERNYSVFQTPFGYFLDLQIEAPGFSLARVFKAF
ncbi:MAG: threonyl-tRNA synthetase editing domain-containing protein [Bacteroidales bacterium]